MTNRFCKIIVMYVFSLLLFFQFHGLNTYGIISQNQLSQDLILHLAMDEGEGDVAFDQIGNGDAQLVGTEWYQSDSYNALEFNGVSSYATINSPPGINKGSFSISVFVNYYSMHEDWSSCIIAQDDSYNGGHFGFQLSHNDHQVWWWAENKELRSINQIELNKWYHIILSYDGTYYRMWVNGVFEGEQNGLHLT